MEIRMTTDTEAPLRCPTCQSHDPRLHPAIQWGGEVQVCTDLWHGGAGQKQITATPVRDDMLEDGWAIQRFAAVMKLKMRRAAEKGRHGWQEASEDELWRMLLDHVEKGDVVDIANFAMIIHQNREPARIERHFGDPAATIVRLSAERQNLRALITRLTSVAENLARETSDPGVEALAAIHCGRNFIYG
jgi:hypothetical protein